MSHLDIHVNTPGDFRQVVCENWKRARLVVWNKNGVRFTLCPSMNFRMAAARLGASPRWRRWSRFAASV